METRTSPASFNKVWGLWRWAILGLTGAFLVSMALFSATQARADGGCGTSYNPTTPPVCAFGPTPPCSEIFVVGETCPAPAPSPYIPHRIAVAVGH